MLSSLLCSRFTSNSSSIWGGGAAPEEDPQERGNWIRPSPDDRNFNPACERRIKGKFTSIDLICRKTLVSQCRRLIDPFGYYFQK